MVATSTWNGANADWSTGADWNLGVPTPSEAASLLGGSVLVSGSEDALAISLANTATVTVLGQLLAHVSIEIGSGATLALQNSVVDSDIFSAGTAIAAMTVDAGGVVSGFGQLNLDITDNGAIQASGGALDIVRGVVGTGQLQIASGATLQVGPLVAPAGSVFPTIEMLGAGATLEDTSAGTTFSLVPLSGFGPGSVIQLDYLGTITPSASFSPDGRTLDITAGTIADSFTLNAPAAGTYLLTTPVKYNSWQIEDLSNLAPVITAPGAVVTQNGSATFSGAAAITVSEAAGGASQNLTATISDPAGTLAIPGIGSGTNLHLFGTQAQISTALGGLTYTPATNQPRIEPIILSVTNGGSSGAYSPNQASATIDVLTDPGTATSWVDGTTGDWTTGTSWTGAAVPTSSGFAEIGGITTYTAEIGASVAEAVSVNTLIVNNPNATLDITNNSTLALSGAASGLFDYQGTLDFGGGTLAANGGTLWIGSSGGFLPSPFGSAVFDHVGVRGLLAIAGSLTAQNGFSIANLDGSGPGRITISANIYDTGLPGITFTDPSFTLNDTVITLAQFDSAYPAEIDGTNGFTLGANATIVDTAGHYGAIDTSKAGTASFVNDGTMQIGGAVSIGTSAFHNAGSIALGGTLDYTNAAPFGSPSPPAIINDTTGTITVTGGTLDGGSFGATADLVNFGAVVIQGSGSISGDLINVGTVDVLSGTFYVAGAISNIFGGTTQGAVGSIVLDPSVVELGTSADTNIILQGIGNTLKLDDPGGFAGTIEGFNAADRIILKDPTAFSQSFNTTTDLLTLIDGSANTYDLQFTGIHTASDFTNAVTAACYAAGTRILTEAGETPIEALAVGDRVATAAGRLARIVWLGHRRIACSSHPMPETVWPVRVRAGAFGPGLPHADLLLSPDHAVLIDGALIPIRCLLNGSGIAQEACDAITYWHLELASHAAVFAQGLPAETYLDTGNRGAFEGAARMQLHPVFAWRAWDQRACAPLLLGGAVLAAQRRRLAYLPTRRSAEVAAK